MTLSPAWRIRRGRLLRPAPFMIAAIVNVTPDSFSDGGSFAEPAAAMARVEDCIAEGAHIIDLGAESTRPGASPISPEEEWQRLRPVLERTLILQDSQAAQNSDTPSFSISIDTYRAETAARAMALVSEPGQAYRGADIINDISGGAFDPAMDQVLASFKPGYVLGHSPARPEHMQRHPGYTDVVDELLRWFTLRMNALIKAGLPEDCICLDPCIGFGKNLAHTQAIVAAIPRFLALGRPLYFGISRKRFLEAVTGQPVGDRDASTQVMTALLAKAGVAVHRVHNVAATVATLKLVDSFS